MKRSQRWYPEGTLSEPFLPQEIDEARQVFPANVADLMPPADSIPDEFCPNYNYGNKWVEAFTRIFFYGSEGLKLYPKKGIDPEKAWTHIITIAGSYQPKHQYKEAACSYLMSLWYTDVKWSKK